MEQSEHIMKFLKVLGALLTKEEQRCTTSLVGFRTQTQNAVFCWTQRLKPNFPATDILKLRVSHIQKSINFRPAQGSGWLHAFANGLAWNRLKTIWGPTWDCLGHMERPRRTTTGFGCANRLPLPTSSWQSQDFGVQTAYLCLPLLVFQWPKPQNNLLTRRSAGITCSGFRTTSLEVFDVRHVCFPFLTAPVSLCHHPMQCFWKLWM